MNKYLLAILFMYGIGITNAQYTAIPDSNFEQALIDQAIDSEGTLDGQVLTSDINTIEELIIVNKSIQDLTGIQDFSNLKILDISDNPLSTVDLSMNTALEELFVGFNYNIQTIDLSHNVALKKLIIWAALTQLDLTNNPNIEYLDCSKNQLDTIDLFGNPILEVLILGDIDNDYTYNNSIDSLDLGNNPLLTDVIVENIGLNSINLEGCTQLEYLSATFNPLYELDLSSFTNLKYFFCENCNLNYLDVSNNPNLKGISLENDLWYWGYPGFDPPHDNNIDELNLNSNQFITSLDVRKINLTVLHIQNGTNTQILNFRASANPNLSCIFVDDAEWCTYNWTMIDPTSHFVETQQECDALDISEEVFQQSIEIYPNPTSGFLSIASYDNSILKNIIIYNALGQKIMETNQKDNIDISHLDNGIYFVKVESSFSKTLAYKLIKEY